MTYDQWKTTPPEERWGRLICSRCDRRDARDGTDHCEQCQGEMEDEFIAEHEMMVFYQWEPWA